jgi:hypothetical protein
MGRSAIPCRSARLQFAVELRLGEKSRRRAQDLIGAPEFLVLAFQLLQPFAFVTGHAAADALIHFGPTQRRKVSCVQPILLEMD